jgi:hypothetical protein
MRIERNGTRLLRALEELLFWIYPMEGEPDLRNDTFVMAANRAYDAIDRATGTAKRRPFSTPAPPDAK